MTVFLPGCSTWRSPVCLRGHLLLCCRKNNLRLNSSHCMRQTVEKSVFQRRGLWLSGGISALAFAVFNRLWCKLSFSNPSFCYNSNGVLQISPCLTTKSNLRFESGPQSCLPQSRFSSGVTPGATLATTVYPFPTTLAFPVSFSARGQRKCLACWMIHGRQFNFQLYLLELKFLTYAS